MIKLRSLFHRFLCSLAIPAVGLSLSLSASAQSYGVAQEFWSGLSRTDITYPDTAAFTNTPAVTVKTLNLLSTGTLGDGYGQRIRAFILPPATGTYTFWIASDEWSDLYLSTDETPEHRVRIANVATATAQRDFNAQPNQKSAPIQLEAGRRYYIEALHRDGSGTDYLDVRWQLPDDSIEEPITARPTGKPERLIPFRTNSIVTPAFLKQPTNVTALAGRPATISVLVSNQAPVTYQWQANSVDLPGENKPVLQLASVGGVADSGKAYRCVVSNSAGSTPSSASTVTVLPDTTAPTVLGAVNIGQTGVLVSFSEAVSAASATTLGNYSIAGVTIQSVQVAANPSQVILHTSKMNSGVSYQLKVSGIQDLAGLPVAANASATFQVLDSYVSSVGSTGSVGSSVAAGNGFDITTKSREIGLKTDEFFFQWSLVGGNFDYQVRIENLDVSDILAKAGLMARDELTGSNRFAAIFTTPSINGVVFQNRTQVGRDSSSVGSFAVNFPNTWLRLQRSGNSFTGYASRDGVNWTLVGSASIPMPEFIYLGLASTSRSTNTATVARFRDYADATGKGLGKASATDREPAGPASRRTGLVISEIMYNPPADKAGRNLEFVELFNSQPFFEDISGYRLEGDVQFTFPTNTIFPAGSYIVLAKVPADVQAAYGISNVYGPYTNSLGNAGGNVRLFNEIGGLFLDVTYATESPWPLAADNAGHSLVLARPSYGNQNVAGWSISDVVGGSPGQFDGAGAEPLRGVVINEFLANPTESQVEFVELYNHNTEAVDLSGAWLSDSPSTNKFKIPAGTSIPAHGFVSFSGGQLGFGISSLGESLYLVNPSKTRVIDAIRFNGSARGVSQGRYPDGGEDIAELQTVTVAAANTPYLIRDVVINELMYAPITGDNDDEFIELYNRGTKPVALAGWKLGSAVSFTFPSAAVLKPNDYVVVGRNLSRLLANYPNLSTANTFGNYNGSLANSGDRVQLLMPESIVSTNSSGQVTTNVAHVVIDQVTYQKGGRWGEWAAGGGSSLELIDPHSDNRQPSNWADSDESKKSTWTNIEFTGRADLGQMETPDRLHVFLQNPGEALIDDIEVFTASNTNNLLKNPNFESGFTGWTPQGTHQDTTLETTEGYKSSQSMHIRASSRGDNGGNRIRSNLSTAVTANSITTIRAKVRWLAGTPYILLRLRGNYLECAGSMAIPKNLGTPGAPNSRRVTNAGPAVFDVSHTPVLPAAGQPIVVTAHVSDPDGIGSLVLRWRDDNATTTVPASEIPLKDDGAGADMIAGDGIYTATIPGQLNNAMVAYYLEAKDAATVPAVTRFPNDAPTRELLIHVGESQPAGNLATYRIWCTKAVVARWKTRGNQSNHPLDCTFVYNDYRIIYNSQTLYSGSPWHTPGFTGPTGSDAVCDYVYHAPADDLLLGTEDFVLASIGNTDNDPSKLAEQSSYWIARKMGIPYNYRRFFAMRFNGVLRASSVYEDTQQPNGELVDEYYNGDSGGPLHKIEDWFEFDDSGDNKSGNVDATLENFVSIEGKKVARYRVCWRPRSVSAGQDPNDFSELFKAADAVNAPAPEPYITAVESIIDVNRWLGVPMFEHIVGNWDSYGYNRGKNMYAYKPTRGKWGLLMWDIDFDLGSGGDGAQTDVFVTNEPTFARLYGNPYFRRICLRILQEAVDGPLRAESFAPLLDAKYKSLVDNGAAPGPVQSFKDFVRDRRTYLTSQVIPKTNFMVIGTNLITTTSNLVTLSGAAPVTVDSIWVNGTRFPLTWSTAASRPIIWTLKLPVLSGTNLLTLVAKDRFGNVIADGTKTLSVVYQGVDQDPEGQVVINEISASPANADAGYVEIYNRSTTTAFDLTGWRLSGVTYDFPDGASIAPGQYLVIAKDQFAFGAKFAYRVAVLGEFGGNLAPAGEVLSLLRPDAVAGGYRVVDRVRYDASAPWASGPADGGVALELIDASQDNSRVSNWADDGDGWRFVSLTGPAGGTNFFMFLTTPSDVYIDNLSLVAGTQPQVGVNIITNGDFELPLLGTWRTSTNHAASTLSTDTVLAGNSSLHLVATAAGAAATNGSMFQLGLPITVSNIYTLSYWIHQGGGKGTNVVLTVNPISTKFPSLASTQQVTRLLGSPGRANTVAGTVQAYPELWLNEVGPYNSTGPKDAQGQQDPWVELYNSGATPIHLDGFYLSDSYTNLTAWAFPVGSVIQPGELKVVWADGDDEDTSTAQWHTSFRIQPTAGSVALSRKLGAGAGELQILDYLNYSGLKPDEGYGSVPDGQPFFRSILSFVTPGSTNNGASKPLEVKINEWMASNTGFILDPSIDPPSADDWFELYNPGRTAADLSGYYLTDNLLNKNQYKIPAGVVIPAGGYLLVWADGTPSQNSTNSSDLHANFQLSKSGEELGLFAPDGSTIDSVVFGPQTNNVSEGRLPDGGTARVFFQQASPRAANRLVGFNTAPVLAKVGNRVIDERKRFTLQLSATDAEEGSDQLVYTLGPGAPSGATITPTGLFVWRPTEAQGPDKFSVTFRVNDNGTPSLQATETIDITVREVNQAPIFLDARTRYGKAGEVLSFATAVDTDLPVQSLSFRLGADAPVGSSIDPITGVFSWKPTDAQAPGSYKVTVSVSDNGLPSLSSSLTYDIQVSPAASQVIVLTLTAEPTGITLRWDSVVGGQYQVEFKTSLNSPWTNQGDVVTASSATTTVRNLGTAAQAGFYRVRKL